MTISLTWTSSSSVHAISSEKCMTHFIKPSNASCYSVTYWNGWVVMYYEQTEASHISHGTSGGIKLKTVWHDHLSSHLIDKWGHMTSAERSPARSITVSVATCPVWDPTKWIPSQSSLYLLWLMSTTLLEKWHFQSISHLGGLLNGYQLLCCQFDVVVYV